VHNRLHKFALLFLIALFALVSAAASPAAAQVPVNPHGATTATRTVSAESGIFTVSQLGHEVGTADFRLNRTRTGVLPTQDFIRLQPISQHLVITGVW
jgi:hypothetical protein